MKLNWSSISMRDYIHITSIIALLLAVCIGAIVGSQEYLKDNIGDINTLSTILICIYYFYFMAVEFGAHKILHTDGFYVHYSVFGNPRLGAFLLGIVVLAAVGWPFFTDFEFTDIYSYIKFSVMIAIIVCGFFQNFRLLIIRGEPWP
ncbi:MAG: hypothetical protein HQL55_04945 [Magnetococcales bacterium]|nr:hypothetical protein [Magnetococcales bacterium]